jgi:hypothetical protein
MTKRRTNRAAYQRWSPQEESLLRELYPDTPTHLIGPKLGRDLKSVHTKASQMGLHKSAAYLDSPFAGRIRPGSNIGGKARFKPGNVPWTKGIKGYQAGGRSRQTQFKPGQEPHNAKPIGAYRISDGGYLSRKVASMGPGKCKQNWMGVHRLVWMEANGPIPHGYAVVFKLGMHTTQLEQITLDRLELVTRAELMKRNSVHNLPKELAQVVQLRAVLIRQINKRVKHEDRHQ